MPAQDINWKWVGLAFFATMALVIVLFVWNSSGGSSDVRAGAASATSVPSPAPTTTIAGPPLTQPPIAGAQSAPTPAKSGTVSPVLAAAPTTVPGSAVAGKAPTTATTAVLLFNPPTIGSASVTDCRLVSGPGPALANVEWVAHVAGGSNWRAPSATKSQEVLSVSNAGQAYDLWFSTPTPLPTAGQVISLPTSIKFASTVPSDSTVRAVQGPTLQVDMLCH